MYRTILVPLDGSSRAEKILPHAEQLAQMFRAKIVLVQVVEPVYISVGPPEVPVMISQELTQQRADDTDAYLTGWKVRLEKKGIEVVTRVEHGPIVSTIIQVAEQTGADLIALASHGRSGLARVFYGSVAAGLLQHADRTLLIVRSAGGGKG
jgi:nucleotide-binding universal stress UspA family protein